MKNRAARLARKRSTLFEYGIIAALAGIAIVVSAAALGTSLNSAFGKATPEFVIP
jgi:Flp pilus assembly pilin Flp